MVSGRIQDVQLIDVSSDAIELAVEVLDGRRVLIINALFQEARDDRRLAHFGGSEHDHAMAILSWDVEVILRRRHFLNPDLCQSNARVSSHEVYSRILFRFAETVLPGRIYINKMRLRLLLPHR